MGHLMWKEHSRLVCDFHLKNLKSRRWIFYSRQAEGKEPTLESLCSPMSVGAKDERVFSMVLLRAAKEGEPALGGWSGVSGQL